MTVPVEVLPAGAPEAEWLDARRQGIGASEIAAVLGISPWDSPFSLYHRKVNGTGDDWDNEAMRMGRRLEAVVADEFADRHPDYRLLPAGLYASRERPWQLATPDRALAHRGSFGAVVAALECKTAGSFDGWGEEDTDEIPVYYRAQVLWQMDVLGVDRVHVALLVNGRHFREYTVEYDHADIAVMREAGVEFMRRLTEGDEPPIDWAPATTRTLRELHPSVVDIAVEVPDRLARAYAQARHHHDRITQRLDALSNEIRQRIGDGRRAVCGGEQVAARSVYDQTRVDTARLRVEYPDVYAAVRTTSTVNKLLPARQRKTSTRTVREAIS